ncbi:prepilin-type N-terminal cleavage/methylation domain-containing protein [Savagea sp. SN6]|uniref:Prepilin-type N-terminal cleavage/methylation domain-containing protein n=1 Tax=Savagea serpentis TaxID=2785297 RepID=A0A8J7KS56_9BACL|nr:prepilin-type N-terminal cleavage/methylation domain-containing protein [Savagea serpentis]MBF4500214.1 prepilin-type N-terminal cleavage/methylation domain-containing protein [Savagea serpentis]
MKWLKNNKGFTLVEMMLVLVIIAVLVIITVPNVFKYSSTVDERGCEAYHNTIICKSILFKR